ncbi:4-hydroxyacetophenone monooxygenase [Penicillium angulare]|uniref:4-hydroxyacetophenone monooxygenase n=1 Tax=Penicillium angulare TaxID=116970 RepID=UPI002541BC21|nr:4-hydroxyacetophenone monooxygenase [Penicillium angulare]KAJ5279996.1 4-hydroxyacetophenone monooxygenase [Penicillium angulare]
MDTDYLSCLHRENVDLIYNDPIDHITERGIVMRSGQAIDADAIFLANRFETQKPLFPMEIRGQNGQSIADHIRSHLKSIGWWWLEFADSSLEA